MTVPVEPVDLPHAARAWVTGRDRGAEPPPVGRAGNLSHRRPHVPGRLAADRRDALGRMGLTTDDLHLMRQVHGTGVAVVTADTPPGWEAPEADVLVTTEPGRALGVQVADCVPLLLAAPGAVAAVHGGRRGVAAGVVEAGMRVLRESAGVDAADVTAVIGPAIGGCCYEVPAGMVEEVADRVPEVTAETTWGTPSLDLPAGVTALLGRAGVGDVRRVGGCTHCGDGWFSHRRDPEAGRQLGVIVRRG